MFRKYAVVAVVLIICLSMCGCWDSRDINQKNLFFLIGADYQSHEYRFMCELANIKGGGVGQQQGGSPMKTEMLEMDGYSLPQMRDNLESISVNHVHLATVRAVIFTPNFAKRGIEEYLRRVLSDSDYRKTIDILMTDTSLKDIFEAKVTNDTSVGFALEDLIQHLNDEGLCQHISLGDVAEVLSMRQAGFVVPVIGTQDKNLVLTSMGVFRNDKFLGFIPEKECPSIMYFLNPKAKDSIVIKYRGVKITSEIRLEKKKIYTRYLDGKLNIFTDFKLSAEVQYTDKLINADESMQKDLQGIFEKIIKNQLISGVRKSQREFGSDYLKIYNYYKIKYPQKFKTVNWNEEYSKARFQISVNVKVDTTGVQGKHSGMSGGGM